MADISEEMIILSNRNAEVPRRNQIDSNDFVYERFIR